MNSKRRRSVNWEEEEKQLLRSILKDYSHIIEDKSLNTNTNKSKTKAWEEVYKKFNGLNCRQRDLGQLKIKWKRMKINARKSCNTYKKEINKAGGRARPSVKDMLNPGELMRDINPFDSDGLMLTNIAKITARKNSEDDLTTATPLQTDTAKITSKKVPKRKHCKNIMGRPGPDSVSKSSKDLDNVSSVLLHSKNLKEEHRRRMEMAEEEHKIHMKIQEEKLKCAILEREILELRKEQQKSNNWM